MKGGGSSLTHHPYFRETRGGLIYNYIFMLILKVHVVLTI